MNNLKKLLLIGIIDVVLLGTGCSKESDFYDKIPEGCTVSYVSVPVEANDTAWNIASRVKDSNPLMQDLSTKDLVEEMGRANDTNMDYIQYGSSIIVPIYCEE